MNIIKRMPFAFQAALIIMLLWSGTGIDSDFDAVIYPGLTRGGEGIFLCIEGGQDNIYEVQYNNKTYTPYKTEEAL